jgi:hypothetical protein
MPGVVHPFPHYSLSPEGDWEAHLFSVFNGGVQQARVGRIPKWMANAIGASTTIVYLSKDTAKKIRGKHREITFQDVMALADEFERGNVAREGKLHLAFWFGSPHRKGLTIKAIIKATNQGHEIYLKSMYPIGLRRVKALKAKTMILREGPKR